jgi:hypothetical protein
MRSMAFIQLDLSHFNFHRHVIGLMLAVADTGAAGAQLQ